MGAVKRLSLVKFNSICEGYGVMLRVLKLLAKALFNFEISVLLEKTEAKPSTALLHLDVFEVNEDVHVKQEWFLYDYKLRMGIKIVALPLQNGILRRIQSRDWLKRCMCNVNCLTLRLCKDYKCF